MAGSAWFSHGHILNEEARERMYKGTRNMGARDKGDRGNEGTRERGNEGTRERGNEGTRERGNDEEREVEGAIVRKQRGEGVNSEETKKLRKYKIPL